MSQDVKKFDLAERTAKFGEEIIKFCRKISRGPVTDPLVNQLVKCGTSVGANYSEADDAESKLDFKHKIGICKKESKETRHWLRMIAIAMPNLADEARIYWKESNELNLIFTTIVKNSRLNGKSIHSNI